ncbi:MAG: membrane protein insertase YidC, partial [Proteobacteria bacterium]|nr:membrane protein insertase YidC [Pseudomonadota bacterium]
SIDDYYLFNIKQTIINNSEDEFSFVNKASIARNYGEGEDGSSLVHEGAIGVCRSKLNELSFGDMRSLDEFVDSNCSGWRGFSDKYWISAIIPQEKAALFKSHSYYDKNTNLYRSDIDLKAQKSNPKTSISNSIYLIAGAKQLDLLHFYQDTLDIEMLERAVDFGILYFITKPIFLLLHEFYEFIGNFGLAIILLTILIKILLFPLAYKSAISMNKLKVLQPKIMQIKERNKDDTIAFQREMMNLYKKEKVNPMSGCLPILLQMPIFFALYKVLSVTIEMRHAGFYLWIQDLSAADPTSILNLFGILPWDAPSFLSIGILPILMAASMYVQQRLNPEPADPMQAKIMKFLPLIFLFMFSSFPSGLVLYWICSNILSIIQQITMKRMQN